MIIGSITVGRGAVLTHRDIFILSNISVVSVRRPYLAGSVLLSLGMAGFVASFVDLLYPDELIAAATLISLLLLLGINIAQLSLLSRDLKGSELSSAVWGTAKDLHQARARIVAERQRVIHDHDQNEPGFDGHRPDNHEKRSHPYPESQPARHSTRRRGHGAE